MKENYELCLAGKNCMFVPYRPEHLPNYHEWMQDSYLLEATASEPLTMDQEIEMQREWRDDEKKCTFIILARDLVPSGNSSDIPPPPAESRICNDDNENEYYPNLIEQTLDAMIGDINLFLSEEESEESDDENNSIEQATDRGLTQAELDIMIAAASHRHKDLGTELALMMMHYGAKHLRLRRFFAKIKDTNHSSLKLFKEKLGYVQCAYAECFGEYELECKCDTPEEMVDWIERRWQWWCQKKNGTASIATNVEESCSGDEGGGHVDESPFGMYEVYKCPLNSPP
mmetsp:Transcript_21744/g.45924  ORF Transcript_21744/g.45924 Transcript_21744/m.45924 type:complete len:286 (-) Transcript_21744:1788-2645(-)